MLIPHDWADCLHFVCFTRNLWYMCYYEAHFTVRKWGRRDRNCCRSLWSPLYILLHYGALLVPLWLWNQVGLVECMSRSYGQTEDEESDTQVVPSISALPTGKCRTRENVHSLCLIQVWARHNFDWSSSTWMSSKELRVLKTGHRDST